MNSYDKTKMHNAWIVDWFGFRKSTDVNKFKIIQSIDKLNLATDYKKNKKIYKIALEEYKKRIILLLKHNTYSRKLFEKKVKKKYNTRTIDKIINRMDPKKMQNLYYYLLQKEKPNKSSK